MTSTSARDELAELVRHADVEASKDCPGTHYSNMAEAILAAGYGKEPEDCEPIERSYAKNHAYDALHAELERHSVEVEAIDLIDLADCVVEALLDAGVLIPANLKDPHA